MTLAVSLPLPSLLPAVQGKGGRTLVPTEILERSLFPPLPVGGRETGGIGEGRRGGGQLVFPCGCAPLLSAIALGAKEENGGALQPSAVPTGRLKGEKSLAAPVCFQGEGAAVPVLLFQPPPFSPYPEPLLISTDFFQPSLVQTRGQRRRRRANRSINLRTRTDCGDYRELRLHNGWRNIFLIF